MRTDQNFEKSDVFAPKSVVIRIWRTPFLVRKIPHWTNPPPPDCRRFFWMALYPKFVLYWIHLDHRQSLVYQIIGYNIANCVQVY